MFLNDMFLNDFLNTALAQPWTARYAKFMALVLGYGATVHIGNILGLTGTPWLETPLLWRSLDLLLLMFDVTVAIALWQGWIWSVGAVFLGIILLQWLPYTVWRSQFVLKPEDAQTLNGLIGTEALLLAIFAILIGLKK
ncbi:MAG: hypothetical protein ACPGVO_15165 [Spirulinaceae cyanobacterium]